MKEVHIDIQGPARVIDLGREGERLARAVVFHVEAWTGEQTEDAAAGTFHIICRRQGDVTPYPCAVTREGDTVRWEITSTETARCGSGWAELQYREDGRVVKSRVMGTHVGEALTAVGGSNPAAPAAQWLDAALEAAARAELAVTNPPRPGANKTWEVWDPKGKCYVDTGVPTGGDHEALANRDSAEQHPIEAVTGLRDELDGMAEAMREGLDTKVDKVEGKGLSEADFTDAEKTKLAGVAEGATNDTVEDVLTSESPVNALSANQGRALDVRLTALSVVVDGKQDTLIGSQGQTIVFNADGLPEAVTPATAPMAAVPFTADQWEEDDDKEALTIPAASHGRPGADFLLDLRQLVNGVYVSQTWGCAATSARYDTETGAVILIAPEGYDGKAIFL